MSRPANEKVTIEDIFGGESDLSDIEDDDVQQEQQQQQPAPVYREETPSEDEEQEDVDEGDDDYAQPAAESSRAGRAAVIADGDEHEVLAPPKLPKFKKSGAAADKSGGEPRKRKPKRKPADADAAPEEEPILLDPAEQRKVDLYDRIDQAAKGGRVKKRKRRGGEDDLEVMADEEVARLRQEMFAAAEHDTEANVQRRPATAKLVLLPLVTSTMQKSHLETALLENGVLEAVRRWLEPLPDKSLPALNIQRTLLQLLRKMSIDTQSLRSSELGKIMLFYTKCKRVEPSIKRLADELVMTWVRPIIGRSDKHRGPRPARPSGLGLPSGPQVSQSQLQSRGVRIPETVSRVYTVAPESVAHSHASSRVGTQKATAKKSREYAKRLAEAKKGDRRAM